MTIRDEDEEMTKIRQKMKGKRDWKGVKRKIQKKKDEKRCKKEGKNIEKKDGLRTEKRDEGRKGKGERR